WGATPKPNKPCPTCDPYSLSTYAISPDGRWLAAALNGDPSTVKVWDVTSGRLAYSLQSKGYGTPQSPGDAAFELAFSADSRFLMATSAPAEYKLSIRVWELGAGKQVTDRKR